MLWHGQVCIQRVQQRSQVGQSTEIIINWSTLHCDQYSASRSVCEASWVHLVSPEAIQVHKKLFELISNHQKPFGLLQCHQKLFSFI